MRGGINVGGYYAIGSRVWGRKTEVGGGGNRASRVGAKGVFRSEVGGIGMFAYLTGSPRAIAMRIGDESI